MAWHPPGFKPLSQLIMMQFVLVTRPQWVNQWGYSINVKKNCGLSAIHTIQKASHKNRAENYEADEMYGRYTIAQDV